MFLIKFKAQKWLLCRSYKFRKGAFRIIKIIQFYSNNSGNFILMGDYDAQVTETSMTSFCGIYELKSLINEPTCYKNRVNQQQRQQFSINICYGKETSYFP